MSLVEADLQLVEHLQNTDSPISDDVAMTIRQDALSQLRIKSPLLACSVELRIARQGTQNYINMRVRRQFSTMLHHVCHKDVAYCFMASDKFDATVILIVLSMRPCQDPRLVRLNQHQVAFLNKCVDSFLTKFKLTALGYTYTVEHERKDPNLSHSRHFHLKIHFDYQTFAKLMPAVSIHETEVICGLDPVRYGMTRSLHSWDDVIEKIQADCRQADREGR